MSNPQSRKNHVEDGKEDQTERDKDQFGTNENRVRPKMQVV